MFLLGLPDSEKAQGGTSRQSDDFKEADMIENGWLFSFFLWDTYVSKASLFCILEDFISQSFMPLKTGGFAIIWEYSG